MTNGVVRILDAEWGGTPYDWASGTGLAVTSTYKNSGSYAYGLSGGGNNCYIDIPAAASYYLRCAVYMASTATWGYFEFAEGTLRQIALSLVPASNVMYVHRGNTQIATTSANVAITTGAWFVVEAFLTVHATAGVLTIKINGTPIYDASGLNTYNGGAGVINRMKLGSASSSAGFYFDDLMMRDDTWPGAVASDIYYLAPAGDGADTAWAASAGDRWNCVDEVPTVLTDYVECTSTSPIRNSFTHGALPWAYATVDGVGISVICAQTSGGTATLTPYVSLGGTTIDGTAMGIIQQLGGAGGVQAFFPLAPGNVPWTAARVNSATCGVLSQVAAGKTARVYGLTMVVKAVEAAAPGSPWNAYAQQQ